LTEAEIAERREMARQRHWAKMTALEEGKETLVNPLELGGSSTEESGSVLAESGSVLAESGAESGPVFLAFSRVFSGLLRKGQTLYVLQPQYDPRDAVSSDLLPPHTSTFTVGDMYMLMGRGLVPVEQVPAGNVVGLAGLEDSVIKLATVSSTLACPAFGAMNTVAAPIVRVAIEPLHAADLRPLVNGLKLLNQADPSVEVSVQETGEHILAATGEVHLHKCLDDLEKDYARVKLKVSAPIIPFRETVILPPTIDMVNEEISAENKVSANREPNGKRLVK
jgi:ribosome assembly protein 1